MHAQGEARDQARLRLRVAHSKAATSKATGGHLGCFLLIFYFPLQTIQMFCYFFPMTLEGDFYQEC